MISPPEAEQTLFGEIAILKDLHLEEMETVPRHNTLLKVYFDICAGYKRPEYRGETVVIIERQFHSPLEPFINGWRKLVSQAEFRLFPGDHLTMLTEHTAAMANELTRCLAKGRQLSNF